MTEFNTPEKQRLMLQYLLNDATLFIKCNPILQSGYFDPDLKPAISFIKDYFDEYKSLPSSAQVYAETLIGIEPREPLKPQESRYAENQIEAFCKNSAMMEAIFKSIELSKEGGDRFGEIERLIKDAVTISISRNLGTDYFDDPEARLLILSQISAGIKTGYNDLDNGIGGGLNRKEMIIFAAPSGVGKSITMLNVAMNLCEQGYDGVYFTMELAEEVVSKRADSMMTGIAQSSILDQITKVATVVKQKQRDGYGRLTIKRYPESATHANHLRAYLKEYELVHGKTPDFVVVDYLDIMASVEKVSVENQFIKDKHVTEELRAIANDLNLIMITASQLNRGANMIESLEELSMGHIAGGISKINTTDNLVAIIQTPQMKARNEMMFKLLKTRNSSGVGSYFMLGFNPISLRLTNMHNEKEEAGQALAQKLSSFKKPGGHGQRKDPPFEPDAPKPSGPGVTPKRPADFGGLFQV